MLTILGTAQSGGSDKLGPWTAMNFLYQCKDLAMTNFTVTITVYKNEPVITFQMVILENVCCFQHLGITLVWFMIKDKIIIYLTKVTQLDKKYIYH